MLRLTDGRQLVQGFEAKPVACLGEVRAGCKLVVKDVLVRRGVLLLDKASRDALSLHAASSLSASLCG